MLSQHSRRAVGVSLLVRRTRLVLGYTLIAVIFVLRPAQGTSDEAQSKIFDGYANIPDPKWSPAYNALLLSILGVIDLNLDPSSSANSNLSGSDTDRRTSADTKFRKFTAAMRMIVEIYDHPRTEKIATGEIKNLEDYIDRVEPTRGDRSDVNQNFEQVMIKFREGKLRKAINESLVYSNELMFASSSARQDSEFFQQKRDGRLDVLVSLLDESGGQHGLVSSMASGVLRAVLESFTGSLGGITTAMKVGSHGLREISRHNEEKLIASKNGQKLDSEKALLRAADNLDHAADKVETVYDHLVSDESLIVVIKKVLSLIEDNGKKAPVIQRMILNLERQINEIVAMNLQKISSLNFGREDQQNYTSVEERTAAKLFRRTLFHDYLLALGSEGLKNIVYDLLTGDPRMNDSECLNIIASRFGPLSIKKIQNVAESSRSALVRKLGETAQSHGFRETYTEVKQTIAEDFNRYTLIEGTIGSDEEELHSELAQLSIDDGPLLFNFDPSASGAGSIYQGHKAFGARNGEITPVFVRVQKRSAGPKLDRDLPLLIERKDDIAALMPSEFGQHARPESIEEFIRNYHQIAENELRADLSDQAQRIAAMRLSRTDYHEIGNEKITVELRVPWLWPSVEGSKVSVMELVPTRDVKQIVRDHPRVAQAVALSINRMGLEELYFNNLKQHPMIAKTKAYFASLGYAFDEESFDVKPRSSDAEAEWQSLTVDAYQAFAYYDPTIKTLGDHVARMKEAKLNEPWGHGDPHPGNIFWGSVTNDGDAKRIVVYLGDYGITATMTSEQRSYLSKLNVGAALNDTKFIVGGLFGLASKKDNRRSDVAFVQRLRRQIQHEAEKIIDRFKENGRNQHWGPGEWIQYFFLYEGVMFPKNLTRLQPPLQRLTMLLSKLGVNQNDESDWYREMYRQQRAAVIGDATKGSNMAMARLAFRARKCVLNFARE